MCDLKRTSFLAIIAVAGAIPVFAALEASGATWAERLGFPPDKKIILLHANELGMCYEANAAAARLVDAGLVRSVSAMAPCPWFADAAQWRRAHQDSDIGLELTLNSEFDRYRWKPVAPSDLTAGLCDDEGYFWLSPIQTMVNGSAAEAEHELIAQIDRAKKLGLDPTHLTTHLGALVTRPDLIEVYLRLARRYWIPAVVVELTPEHIARFEQHGFPLPDDIIELLNDYPLPKVDDLRIVPDADSYEEKKEAFMALLDALEPGITQVTVRPATVSDALPRITDDWQQRNWDLQLMLDPDIASAIRDRGIIVTDWKELMRRFEGGADDEAESADPTVAENGKEP